MIEQAKRLVKACIAPPLDAGGLFNPTIKRLLDEPIWIVFSYHRIITQRHLDPFGSGMTVMEQRFTQQLDFIQEHFDVVPVSAAYEQFQSERSGATTQRRPLASITFDDGYADNLECALPHLQKRDLKATVYITTGRLQQGQFFWWDRMANLIKHCKSNQLNLPGWSQYGLPETVYLVPGFKALAIEQLQNAVWRMPIDASNAFIEFLESRYGCEETALLSRRLTEGQVQELASSGIEIGAHAVNHNNLLLMDENIQRNEMSESKRYLETLTNQKVTSFCYPGGKTNAHTARLSSEAGFTTSLAATRGVNASPVDQFHIKRFWMPDSDIADVKRCLWNVGREYFAERSPSLQRLSPQDQPT